MSEPTVFVCRVDTPDGCKDYITLIPPDIVCKQGLPSEAIVGVLLHPLQDGESITPQNFGRNRTFVDFMHSVIARFAPLQPGCLAEAQRLHEGWIYIIDNRTPTPQGSVPAEDIIGALEVKDGKVVPGSYQPSSRHLIFSVRGFFQLEEGLYECLLQELRGLKPIPAM
jgi:hypothetical protein